MNEEEKAIEFLKNKTTNYSLSGEELHYYLILYYLIINLQKENQQLKEQLKTSEKARNNCYKYLKNPPEDMWSGHSIERAIELLDIDKMINKKVEGMKNEREEDII